VLQQYPGFSGSYYRDDTGQPENRFLRDEFLDFCDQLNIDAILEPIKR
jgi:hypothetical protein